MRLMTAEAGPALPLRTGRAGFLGRLALFTGVVGIGVGLNYWITGDTPPVAAMALGAVVAVAAAVFLLLRWRPMLLYAALACAGVTAVDGSQSANPGWFAILLVMTWCTLTGGRRLGLPLWLAAMALFTVEWAVFAHDGGWGAWLSGTTFVFLAGLLLRNQYALVAQLRAAQAGLAAKARAEERNRISRDVHDVIAHSLTVSLLHVMSARLAVESDPADAARSLAEAERLGRESLAEVRQVVGLLRADAGSSTGVGSGADAVAGQDSDGDGTGFALPQPGVAGVPALVERFQAAGADISLAVDGDIGRLPATVGLAVYRILQEALTNVVRHAPGAPTTVRLAVSAHDAALTVDSLGKPGGGAGAGTGHRIGHGIVGMRERAESAGGRCSAVPSGAGWLVRADFPLPSATSAPTTSAVPASPEDAS